MADNKMETLVQHRLDDLLKPPAAPEAPRVRPVRVVSIPRAPKAVTEAAEIYRRGDEIKAEGKKGYGVRMPGYFRRLLQDSKNKG